MTTTRAAAGSPGDGFTIGEVLNQLKEDFEDITISKIRFLESEGLVYPDRTESGYRKFTEDDVDRLRFILTAQRDHYLPLKVIREQLERLDSGQRPSSAMPTSSAAPRVDTGVISAGRPPEVGQPISNVVPGAQPAPSQSGFPQPGPPEPSLLEQPVSVVTLSLREFCQATGLDTAEVRSLKDFGIVGDRKDDSGQFDGDDVLAGRAARELLTLGLEARHLRMYRQFVDRELALFEQLVIPLLRQRNPEARRQAVRQLEKLGLLTGKMKRALLARALRGYLGGA
ncbi:MAG: transcriptional regulator FtsR [Egibacteraceae bacterium]